MGNKYKLTINQRIAIVSIIVSLVSSTIFAFLLNIQSGKISEQAQDKLFNTQAAFNQHMSETQIAFSEKMNDDQKEFQKVLIATQTELDRLSSLATITVKYTKVFTWNFTGGFLISNTGRTTANNLVVLVSLNAVDNQWKNIVKDIEDFRLELPYNQSRTITTEDVETDSTLIKLDGHNRYIIKLGNLAPGKEIYIQIHRPGEYNSSTFMNTVYRKLIIYTKDTNEPNIDRYWFRGSIEKVYSMATFTALAYCDNCTEDTSLTGIDVSTLGDFDPNLTVPTRISKDGWYITEYTAYINYVVPIQFFSLPEDTDLEFIKNQDGTYYQKPADWPSP